MKELFKMNTPIVFYIVKCSMDFPPREKKNIKKSALAENKNHRFEVMECNKSAVLVLLHLYKWQVLHTITCIRISYCIYVTHTQIKLITIFYLIKIFCVLYKSIYGLHSFNAIYSQSNEQNILSPTFVAFVCINVLI